MPKIVLTEEQAEVLAQTQGKVAVHDRRGNLLGHFEPLSPAEEIAELERLAGPSGPCYTSAQVQAHLRALEREWERTGGFDEAYMYRFLEKLRAADPGHLRPTDDQESQSSL